MSGSDVYLFTLNKIPTLVKNYLKIIKNKNFDFYIFHQASRLILESLRNKLDINKKKFVIDLKYGNTTSSSIPIALKNMIDNKKIKKNQKILVCGFGVGLAWGITSIEI